MLYQVLQGQMEELQKNAQTLQMKYVEVETTRLALDDVKKTKEGTDILVPLGTGVYTAGKTHNADLLVEVGAGIAVNKSAAEAEALLERKKKEIEKAAEGLQEEMMSVSAKISQLAEELQSEVQQAQQ